MLLVQGSHFAHIHSLSTVLIEHLFKSPILSAPSSLSLRKQKQSEDHFHMLPMSHLPVYLSAIPFLLTLSHLQTPPCSSSNGPILSSLQEFCIGYLECASAQIFAWLAPSLPLDLFQRPPRPPYKPLHLCLALYPRPWITFLHGIYHHLIVYLVVCSSSMLRRWMEER